MSQAQQESGSAKASSSAVFLLGLLLIVPAFYLNPSFLQLMWPGLAMPLRDFATTLWTLDTILWIFLLFCLWQSRIIGTCRWARLVLSRHTWLAAVLFNALALAALAGLFEMLFWQLNTHKVFSGKPYHNIIEPSLYCEDNLLGFRANVDRTCEDRCYSLPKRKSIFRKYYTLDEAGFRCVPQADGLKNAHLLCFGCSYTFGIGADDAETFPSYLADGHESLHVYNLAMAAWGPSQTVLRMQQGVLNVVQEEPGAAVYLMMSDHLNRIVPCMHNIGIFTRNFPAFELMPDGHVAYAGSFPEAYPRRMWWLDFLRNEHYLKWSLVDLPPSPSGSTIQLAAALLAEARAEYQQRYPQNEFYVMLDPTCGVDFPKEAVAQALKTRGIPVLDATKANGANPWADHYPFDGHPLPKLHCKLAQWFWDQFPNGLLAPPKP